MGATVQVRLDKKAEADLEILRRRGLTISEALRKGIHLAVRETSPDEPIEIVGLGKYDSGITDLATNKKHLAGLGRKVYPVAKATLKRAPAAKSL